MGKPRGKPRAIHRVVQLSIVGAVVAALVAASSAQAATVTVGSPLTATFITSSDISAPETFRLCFDNTDESCVSKRRAAQTTATSGLSARNASILTYQ